MSRMCSSISANSIAQPTRPALSMMLAGVLRRARTCSIGLWSWNSLNSSRRMFSFVVTSSSAKRYGIVKRVNSPGAVSIVDPFRCPASPSLAFDTISSA